MEFVDVRRGNDKSTFKRHVFIEKKTEYEYTSVETKFICL